MSWILNVFSLQYFHEIAALYGYENAQIVSVQMKCCNNVKKIVSEIEVSECIDKMEKR